VKVQTFAFLTLLGSAAFAAEPGLIFADRTKPVEICGLRAPSLDQTANALVERGGVREAAGDEKFVAYEQLDFTHIWTFTRLGHAAHPTAVCRELKDGSAGLEVSMQFVCGGAPEACAVLYRDFIALNEEMRAKARKPPA
jgi:hypothetical protein